MNINNNVLNKQDQDCTVHYGRTLETTKILFWDGYHHTNDGLHNICLSKSFVCSVQYTTISNSSDLAILKHNFQYLLFLCKIYDDCSMLLSACLFQNKPNKQNYEDCGIPTTYCNHRCFYTKIINIESRVSKLLNHLSWKL